MKLEKAVRGVLEKAAKPMTFPEVYGRVVVHERSVRRVLFEMAKKGEVTRRRISNGGTPDPIMEYSLVKK